VWVPAAIFGGFALLLVARLVQLQVIEHPVYAARARTELAGDTTIFARRGSILDRNGNVLATSVDTWDVYVNSRAWKDAGRANDASEALARALRGDPAQPRLEPGDIRQLVQQGQSIDVLVVRDLDYETGRLLMKDGIPGVILLPDTARVNPEGDTAASVLGFIGRDNVGLAGIESEHNDVLQGTPGKAIFERDTTGDPIPFGQYVASDPVPGKDVVLTIDRYLQRMVEQRLEQAMKEHRAKGGAIIVMDPSSGEILAMATSPGLKFSTLDLSDKKQTELLRNRAVTDLYEPGRVMKVVTASAALDQGVVTPDTGYVDNGVVYIYDIPIRNWDSNVYGPQTMTEVLQNSVNTGAVFMVEKLGQETFHRYLDAFGFGKPTGVDLNGESGGIIRRPADPDWSPVDLATQSFGQSISVTPIQMINAIATAINGGRLVRPHLAKALVAPDGKREDVTTEVRGQAISPATSATMRQMLKDVIDPAGRVHPGKPKEYTAGGKSGTANVPIPNGYDDRQVASFVGFAPFDDPKILVLVKLDENADMQTGTVAAGPIFSKLADDILHYLNVRPDAAKYVGAR